MSQLVWIDVETTGLVLWRDYLLEIAVATSDMSNPFELTHVLHRTFPVPPAVMDRLMKPCNEAALDMHRKNGLFNELERSSYPVRQKALNDCDRELSSFLSGLGDKPVLAGSSVHFDRGFINIELPKSEKLFSHRHYDVSSVQMFCQSIGMPPLPAGTGVHRAKADIIESAERARMCADWVRNHVT